MFWLTGETSNINLLEVFLYIQKNKTNTMKHIKPFESFEPIKESVEEKTEEWFVDEMSEEQDGEGFDGMWGVYNQEGFCKNYYYTEEDAQKLADELNNG